MAAAKRRRAKIQGSPESGGEASFAEAGFKNEAGG